MNTKKRVLVPFGVILAITLPVALSTACSIDTALDFVVVSPEEAAVRDNLINGDVSSSPILRNIREHVFDKAAAGKITPATYLANNSPQTWAVADYANIFLDGGIFSTWKLPRGTVIIFIEVFAQLFVDLQIDTTLLYSQTKAAIDKYAPVNALATNVWDTFIKTFTQIFSPDNNHENLIKFFTGGTTPLISRSDFNKIDRVLSSPDGHPSGLKKENGSDILGYGGTSILPAIPTATA